MKSHCIAHSGKTVTRSYPNDWLVSYNKAWWGKVFNLRCALQKFDIHHFHALSFRLTYFDSTSGSTAAAVQTSGFCHMVLIMPWKTLSHLSVRHTRQHLTNTLSLQLLNNRIPLVIGVSSHQINTEYTTRRHFTIYRPCLQLGLPHKDDNDKVLVRVFEQGKTLPHQQWVSDTCISAEYTGSLRHQTVGFILTRVICAKINIPNRIISFPCKVIWVIHILFHVIIVRMWHLSFWVLHSAI